MVLKARSLKSRPWQGHHASSGGSRENPSLPSRVPGGTGAPRVVASLRLRLSPRMALFPIHACVSVSSLLGRMLVLACRVYQKSGKLRPEILNKLQLQILYFQTRPCSEVLSGHELGGMLLNPVPTSRWGTQAGPLPCTSALMAAGLWLTARASASPPADETFLGFGEYSRADLGQEKEVRSLTFPVLGWPGGPWGL